MRTFEGEIVLTLKELSEKHDVPVSWLRKQIGKSILPGGGVLRMVRFPADKNFYLFVNEVDVIAKPRVYGEDYIKRTQEVIEQNHDADEEADE